MVSLIAVFQTQTADWVEVGNVAMVGYLVGFWLLIIHMATLLQSGLSSVSSIFAVKCRPVYRTALSSLAVIG